MLRKIKTNFCVQIFNIFLLRKKMPNIYRNMREYALFCQCFKKNRIIRDCMEHIFSGARLTHTTTCFGYTHFLAACKHHGHLQEKRKENDRFLTWGG